MLAVNVVEPVFVRTIPRELVLGQLYVSMEYGTVVHACCCGCGKEVVTPMTPTDWRIEYDGERITLRPSVGNWSLPCRSHYIIRANRVIECGGWADDRVEAERRRDAAAKKVFYARRASDPSSTSALSSTEASFPAEPTHSGDEPKSRRTWFRRLRERAWR